MCLGVPGKVLEIVAPSSQNSLPLGKVQFGGIVKDICLAYLPDVAVGDYVLVHVGFAISKIDEAEAEEIFSYIRKDRRVSDQNDPFAIPEAEADREVLGS